MSRVFALLILLSLFVTSCSTFAPALTPTPTHTATPVSTETPLPTPTLTPTNTPELPTETPDVISALLPSGVPDKEWNGIPIMPDAINGAGDEKGYRFTTKANPRLIQTYYQSELGKQGANLMAAGVPSGKDVLILIFQKGTETISISIIPHEDVFIVLITR